MKTLNWYYIVTGAAIVSLTLTALKITDCITWKWVWVASPLWIVATLFLIIMIAGVYVIHKDDLIYNQSKRINL